MKKQTKWRIGNHQALSHFYEYACELVKDKPFVIRIEDEKRNLDQNALFHVFCQQIASQREDETLATIKSEIKLLYGIPILVRDDSEYAIAYNRTVAQLAYPEQLHVMSYWPVTRLMNKTQMRELIDNVIREYAQQGYFLTHPEDKSFNQYPEFQR